MTPINPENIKDPELRKKILAALADEPSQERPEAVTRLHAGAMAPRPLQRSESKGLSKRKKVPNPKGPNKTEERFRREFLMGRGMYEAMTFRLAGGSRYTPDWITPDENGRYTAYEVKGSYRFHSQGRALTAFRECRARFVGVKFRWFELGINGSWTEKYKEGEI